MPLLPRGSDRHRRRAIRRLSVTVLAVYRQSFCKRCFTEVQHANGGLRARVRTQQQQQTQDKNAHNVALTGTHETTDDADFLTSPV